MKLEVKSTPFFMELLEAERGDFAGGLGLAKSGVGEPLNQCATSFQKR